MKKSEKEEKTVQGKSISKKSKVTSLYVKVSELKIHPHYEEIYFKPHASIVEALATDIKERGLIVLPTINKNYEILSGTIRIEALMNIGYETIDVIVLDINKEEELKYMIGKTSYFDHQKPELLTSAVILLLSFNLYYVKSYILSIY